MKSSFFKFSLLISAMLMLLCLCPLQASAEEPQYAVTYDINAEAFDPKDGPKDGLAYPGVYEVKAEDLKPKQGTEAETIGIPSIADGNLTDAPTTESPAIIQGAAVGYEEKVGPTEYRKIEGAPDKPAPYTEFPVQILQQETETGTIPKLSGYDGTYVILRLDVTNYFANDDDVLHVQQTENKALIPGAGMLDPAAGQETVPDADKVYRAFADGVGTKTGAYKKADLCDNEGGPAYVDVLLYSSGKLAAGGDVGKPDVPDGNVPVQMYVDKELDYNPELKYDPASTDVNHVANVLKKFFDAAKTAAENISHYLVKGADLALETAVEKSGGPDNTETTYWSLERAIEETYYDQPIDASPEDSGCGKTVKLICEVPVTDEMVLQGTDAEHLRKRTLDVNSFDIQIANNSEQDASGFTLENAWLKIEDKSNTSGAELAIGNNAKFVIEQGGKLIIDQTCQLEIEWDGGTTTPVEGEPQPEPDVLNNGILDLRAGGEVENNGVITVEGPEGKPLQEQTQTDSEKGYGELTIAKDAKLTNNGALVVYGKLYNLGTLVNNGKYDELITSTDPDKGSFSYHKGIQVSWKDDVTQANVWPGVLINGEDKNGNQNPDAVLENNGDLILVPGSLENRATLNNEEGARILLATATEAIIPIVPDPANPLIVTKRIQLDPVKISVIDNYGTINNAGTIAPATVALNDDLSFGTLSVPGNLPQLFTINNYGIINNTGYIYVWEGGLGKELLAVFAGADTWLYLYRDGSFLMILPSGERVTGSYSLDGGLLTLTPDDGTQISTVPDETGGCIIRVVSVSGSEFELAVAGEDLLPLTEAA